MATVRTPQIVCYPRNVSDAAALLERQRAYFASDERLRERAALWRDASRDECLIAVEESCREAAEFLARLDPVMLERALEPPPIPDDTRRLLEHLWQTRRR